jgi:hypothetical protein
MSEEEEIDIAITLSPEELRIAHRLKSDVYDNPKLIDPFSDHYWYEITYGFFLGAGLEPARARELAMLAFYDDWLNQLPPRPSPPPLPLPPYPF